MKKANKVKVKRVKVKKAKVTKGKKVKKANKPTRKKSNIKILKARAAKPKSKTKKSRTKSKSTARLRKSRQIKKKAVKATKRIKAKKTVKAKPAKKTIKKNIIKNKPIKRTVKKKTIKKPITKKMLAIEQVKESMFNPYMPQKYDVLKVTRECPDSFTIRVDMKTDHDPGQFVQVSLPGIGEAPISICSWSDKYIDLNIREVGNVTKNLAKIQKGDTLLVRGPYGKGYPMHHFEGDSIIIIGGGCGFAPLKGIVEYIEKNRDSFADIHMFLGFRDPNEVLFKKELKQWHDKYKIALTVDKKPAKTCWDGRVGFVTNMLQKSDIDNFRKIVFICGPPIMMKACIDILKDKGFNDDQIYVSAERMMNCALGICGHCMIHGKYVCIDGPVFRWDELRDEDD